MITGMTVSLDGFIADASGSASPVYPDFAEMVRDPWMARTIRETGAVIMGRRTFQMGDSDSYLGQYEFQVPIFVLTHQPPQIPPKQDDRLTFTFLEGDIHEAVTRAKAAAGDLDVQVVGGADVSRQILTAGLADELRLDIVPVVLGTGLPFFNGPLPGITLRKTTVRERGIRTSLTFAVQRTTP
ncbi:dihydrofolate reductase family protein [Spongiactinospora sp. TRM90649]|uniref:dihydrofolate reductase family protein n=1 Tax=Spongiactinospora sp. TRM90649 TaxID=3031114 RepID=UPI0023F6F300|nr:dihydrofolate reductase family protein [Spongiactinospora sp. TRM90649]MDF5758257.1 dihydrofolate reductase family protein [Spongiactinospora sp. TRM90649]